VDIHRSSVDRWIGRYEKTGALEVIEVPSRSSLTTKEEDFNLACCGIKKNFISNSGIFLFISLLKRLPLFRGNQPRKIRFTPKFFIFGVFTTKLLLCNETPKNL
jgi:hypothetical protein